MLAVTRIEYASERYILFMCVLFVTQRCKSAGGSRGSAQEIRFIAAEGH